MSNLLRSKILVGVAAFAVMFVGFVGNVSTASADCSLGTVTLRVGSRGSAVACLQSKLDNGIVADGVFGPKTKARVMAWQASVGLTADGVVGAHSRAQLVANGGVSGNFPAGCNSASGYSPTTGQPCSGGTVVVSGPVSVSLATNNPASGTLVAGQATADLAHFNFTGNGVVTGVTLQRIGVSADATLSNVYLFDGANRLTDAASVSNNGMISFSAPSGLFTVSGSKVISVRSDIASGTSGQTVGVMLKSYSTSAGTVNANLSGNIQTIASASLASVSAGTVTPSGAIINTGAQQTLWQSTLTVSNRDVWMKRLALRQVGSALASSLANFKLYVNGVQVGSASMIDPVTGYVTFDMSASPVLLVAGSRTVRVDADVVSGASRTVQLSVRNAADVDFVDSSFGVNVSPTSTPWTASAASTIAGASGGTLTVEKDVSSPSTNVVNNGSDVTLGVFKLTAFGEPIKLETLRMTYDSSDNTISSLRNGRVLINGVQYGSTATLIEKDATTGYTSYTVNYTVMPGTPALVELRADIYDNDGTDNITPGTDTLTGQIAAGSSNALRVDSLGYFNAPSAAVSANTLTVASTTISLARNGTYATAQTTVLPATNYKIGSWNLSGSSVEDVLLTTLSFDVDEVSGTEFDEGDITNMYVVVKDSSTGAVVAQPSPIATLSTGGQDNNFSINYTLAKNKNVSIELYGNLADDGQDDDATTSSGSTNAIDSGDSFRTDLTVTGTSLVGGTSITASSADTQGQTIAFGSASITATIDASTPVSAIVADNQAVTSASFKFAAITASYRVTDITLTLASAAVVNSVDLYDGSTLVGSLPGNTSLSFSGLNLVVPANSSKVLNVRLNLGTVMDATSDGTGTTAGSSLLTTLTAFTAVNTSTGVSATGTESDPAGNVMYVYAAIPTIMNAALSTDNIVAGTNTFYKYTVTSTGGSITWKKIKFNISRATTNAITTNSFTVWDENGIQVAGAVTLADTSTDNDCADVADTTCTVSFVATNEQGVSGSKTYTLKGSVSGTLVDGDYFATNILQPSSFVAPDDYTAVAGTGATFVWSDLSGNGHDPASTTVTDWNNDYLVKFLPTDAETLTRSL